MTRILAVAGNTFRESVRDKALYVLLAFAAAAILGSKALGWISVGQDIKVVKDISLASVSLFGVLISIFVGANLVYKEIDKRTIYTIVSRPIHRAEFVLGKYLGLAALLFVVTAAMTAGGAAYVVVLGGRVAASFFFAALLSYCELLLITAAAVLLSSLTSPILGAVVVFCLYLGGHATGILLDLPPHFEGTWLKSVMEGAYYIIPNLSNFNIRSMAANNVPVRLAYIGWAVAYGLVYTAMLLGLAALAFEDKDL